MRKQIAAMAAMFLCVFSLLSYGGKIIVSAESQAKNVFSGNAELLRQDNDNYVIQVTVENKGEDFSGTVQMVFAGSGSTGNCAYNTEITLPAQGKKQFTITVTQMAVDTVQDLGRMNFLDEKGRVLESIQLNNVFGKVQSGIPVGVLSDNYQDITFMDAGGEELYLQGTTGGPLRPLSLVELDQDNLRGYLDGLYFLLIDRFNVSTLSEEDILAIQKWVEDGGWLMIGTGEYAHQTLSGFEEDFLGVEVKDISEPGEENIASLNAERQGYYSYYYHTLAELDFTQMAVANLDHINSNVAFYESGDHPAIFGAVGEGAVAVFYTSFGEEELQKLYDDSILSMYNDLMHSSNSYQSYSRSSDLGYIGQRSLAFIDNINTNLDFTWLEVLIAIYVVLAGPVLYLILRKCKKSEWYWIGVPVLGLVFIVSVFYIGLSARVNETRVFSVAVQQAGANRADTYFLAYHSGIKPWTVHLKEEYDAAGPGLGGYSSSYRNNADDYFYIVSNDDKGMAIGIKPRENFESGYLYAGGKAKSSGNITGTGIHSTGVTANVKGTITNGTSNDLAYMAVVEDSYVMVFSNVAAGETIDLHQAYADGRCVYSNNVSYYGSFLNNIIYSGNEEYKQDDMAALIIGISVASEKQSKGQGDAIVVGVVENYDKAMAGECEETAYACLYSYVETEVNHNASN